MENSKKIAAAVSSVFAFIKTQEEMAYMQAAASLPAAGQILPKAALVRNGDGMENSKKIAAAVSGVFAFIKTQEEMAYMQAAASLPAAGQILPKAAGPAIPISIWCMSGRLAQMQMRNTMQLKGFHGLKIK